LNNFFQPKIKIFLYLCEVREQGTGNREECSQANELGYVVKSEQGAVLLRTAVYLINYPIPSSGKYIKIGFNTP